MILLQNYEVGRNKGVTDGYTEERGRGPFPFIKLSETARNCGFKTRGETPNPYPDYGAMLLETLQF